MEKVRINNFKNCHEKKNHNRKVTARKSHLRWDKCVGRDVRAVEPGV